MNEKEVIKKVIQGDKQAFGKLAAKYEKFIFNIAKRIVKKEHDAEDVAQEVLLKLYKNMYQFKYESKFSVWLYRIVYNLSINFLNKEKKNQEVNIDDISDSALGLNDFVDKAYDKQLILIYSKNLLNQLPYHYKVVIDLYYFKEFTYQEIAEELDIPINTVKTHILRAKKTLKKIISNETNSGK